jgi:hypothetical protein
MWAVVPASSSTKAQAARTVRGMGPSGMTSAPTATSRTLLLPAGTGADRRLPVRIAVEVESATATGLVEADGGHSS